MSPLLKLSTSMAALLIGVTVANAQVQTPSGQAGGGEQLEQRQGGGGDGQQGKQERRGDTNKDDGATKQRQGASEDKADTKQRTTGSDDTKQERKAQGDTKEQTGQGTERKAQGKDGEAKDQKAQGQDAGGKEKRTTEGGSKKRPQAKITQKEKTVIRERVIEKAPKRYTRNEVNFNITVGTAVPSTYVIYDMPPSIIEFVPEYQGYDYIVVGDVLLIIDPDTREIVDVVQV